MSGTVVKIMYHIYLYTAYIYLYIAYKYHLFK